MLKTGNTLKNASARHIQRIYKTYTTHTQHIYKTYKRQVQRKNNTPKRHIQHTYNACATQRFFVNIAFKAQKADKNRVKFSGRTYKNRD